MVTLELYNCLPFFFFGPESSKERGDAQPQATNRLWWIVQPPIPWRQPKRRFWPSLDKMSSGGARVVEVQALLCFHRCHLTRTPSEATPLRREVGAAAQSPTSHRSSHYSQARPRETCRRRMPRPEHYQVMKTEKGSPFVLISVISQKAGQGSQHAVYLLQLRYATLFGSVAIMTNSIKVQSYLKCVKQKSYNLAKPHLSPSRPCHQAQHRVKLLVWPHDSFGPS